ncbi:MAG: acyl-CoA/acyl-ACP dehydrogenase [Actinomycetota bacterium]|nr:acyl-CoA/acyl-ACP dehydrogenase [Actinomycetota bacterium]
MDFTYDAEQLALRDVARQALDRAVDADTLGALADDPQGITGELWHTIVELGWTGLLVPAEHGGAGAGLLETGIVLEQMGRVPLPGPFFSSAVLATLAARALGADELLGSLAAGVQRGTVALHELGHGDPLATVRSRARRKGAGWVVSGTKPLVLDGHTADWMIVVARSEEGLRSFAVDLPGDVDVQPVPTLDPTRKAARVVLDDVRAVPLGPPGHQGPLWRTVLDDASIGLASELVGVADRALEEATEYTKERVVFDRPVAANQVVRHRLVDMFHALEMARAGAQYAAWMADSGAPPTDRERTAAMAAGYAAETAVKLTGDNIQLHGGVGFTWANVAHFLFKRAKQNDVLIGGSGSQRLRLAQMIVSPV